MSEVQHIYTELLDIKEDIGKIKSQLDSAIVINIPPKWLLAAAGMLAGGGYLTIRVAL